MNMKSLYLAGAMALAPLAASAITLDTDNNIVDGGIYDVLAEEYSFGAGFEGSDIAGTFTFTFENNEAFDVAVTTTFATVLQSKTSVFTITGVTFEYGDGSDSLSFAPGVTGGGNMQTVIGAGGSVNLIVEYGDPIGTPDLDLLIRAEAVAVPLPAGVLLLGTALAGLGLARRRKA